MQNGKPEQQPAPVPVSSRDEYQYWRDQSVVLLD
jgi:hypothetical protein